MDENWPIFFLKRRFSPLRPKMGFFKKILPEARNLSKAPCDLA
jgi:hypothetical protein